MLAFLRGKLSLENITNHLKISPNKYDLIYVNEYFVIFSFDQINIYIKDFE